LSFWSILRSTRRSCPLPGCAARSRYVESQLSCLCFSTESYPPPPPGVVDIKM
jgi:hypothetical protein